MASLHGHSQNPLSLPFQPPHSFTLIWQRAGDKTGTGIIVNQIKIVNNNNKKLGTFWSEKWCQRVTGVQEGKS